MALPPSSRRRRTCSSPPTNPAKEDRKGAAALPLPRVTVQVVENRGRDEVAFLCDLAPQLRGYVYACFMHDKRPSDQARQRRCQLRLCLQRNVCKNAAHVLNILCEFENDPYLGILCPPFPARGLYFMNMCSGGWGPQLREHQKAAERDTQVGCAHCGRDRPLRPYGECVLDSAPRRWPRCSTTAGSIPDFRPSRCPRTVSISHAIERVYPFVAQAAGYYPAVVMSRDYAVIRNDTMRAYATGMIRPLARVF